jgi:uncharacterized phage protein (TIGR01671 family)
MDRFKFRVFDNEDKIFLTNARIYQDGKCYGTFKGEWYKDRLSEIEMCTGLKDKNGVLIYEGDILSCSSIDEKYLVVWDRDICAFKLEEDGDSLHEFDNTFDILGNIHENKELIKGE